MNIKIVLLTIVFVLGSMTIFPKTGLSASAEKASWGVKMQALYQTLGDVLNDVTSDRRYNDPENRARIQGEADRLAAYAHDLTGKGMVTIDADPTVEIVATMLGRDTRRAAQEFKRGNRAYARTLLKLVPSYCIACHTRNGTGPQFAQLTFEPNKSFSPLERGEFFAATRQFDRAQVEFRKIILNSKSTDTNGWDWEKALHQSMSIAIRVKKDPAQAREIVDAVLRATEAPSFIEADAKLWKTSIAEWQAEAPVKAVTEEAVYKEANRLMAKAREVQKYPMDRSADILYLRASAAVHDLLQAFPKGKYLGEALYMAGLNYEILSPLATEDLHEIFYEACIRKTPHSDVAALCYRRLESSIIFGYTGSAGTEVTNDVRQKLRELSDLAAAVKKNQL